MNADNSLRRVITFWPLVLYGMGIIIGAGVYVALGTVIERAGAAAPISFLLAGLCAATTGLCYAELAGRFPETSGGAAYVRRGFQSDALGFLVGVATTLAVAVAAASIARGAAGYLSVLIPGDQSTFTILLVAGFSAVAISGVRASVGWAAAIGAAEILGLLVATVAGLRMAPEWHFEGMIPNDPAGWKGVIAGSFVAFFAFIGFETLANLAEEVEDAPRVVPRAILYALGASLILYLGVAIAAVMAHQRGAFVLLELFAGKSAVIFAFVAFLSVANGVLVEIMMLSRLFYGMARNGQLPGVLARVEPRTGTPAIAVAVSGAIVLIVALFVPFDSLLVAANALTLCIFALVDVALLLVKARDQTPHSGFVAPRWTPLVGAILALALFAGEFAR